MKEMILSSLMIVLLLISVLVGLAFLTLLERKILGYIQLRKGPNKVGVVGVLQPFSDAIKLFTKEQTYPLASNYSPYYISPVFALSLMMVSWLVAPLMSESLKFSLGVLFLLACLSMGVYGTMLAGWSSNSNYSLLGGLRASAQTISYEVSLALILFSFLCLMESYKLTDFEIHQANIWYFFLGGPLAMMMWVSLLAETNRTPFDFAEGESELVSGFNVEYSSSGFALIFMAEYGSIIFMSYLFALMFLGGNYMEFTWYLKVCCVSMSFIWVRGLLPRYRYDKLMNLTWKTYLPVVLNYIVFFILFKFFTLM